VSSKTDSVARGGVDRAADGLCRRAANPRRQPCFIDGRRAVTVDRDYIGRYACAAGAARLPLQLDEDGQLRLLLLTRCLAPLVYDTLGV
jgi:hypothetical protein